MLAGRSWEPPNRETPGGNTGRRQAGDRLRELRSTASGRKPHPTRYDERLDKTPVKESAGEGRRPMPTKGNAPCVTGRPEEIRQGTPGHETTTALFAHNRKKDDRTESFRANSVRSKSAVNTPNAKRPRLMPRQSDRKKDRVIRATGQHIIGCPPCSGHAKMPAAAAPEKGMPPHQKKAHRNGKPAAVRFFFVSWRKSD